MSGHLSSVEISEWLAGIRASDAERHLAECAVCAAELERAGEPLARFGAATRAWCAAETPVPRLGSVGSAVRRRQRFMTMRVALAEAILEPLHEAANPDDAKVLPQIDRVAEARAELEKANARMLLGLRHVLTPEQWKALESEEHGPHGPEGHGGPGGQHMMPPPPPHPEHD
jgi:hypothetical protein